MWCVQRHLRASGGERFTKQFDRGPTEDSLQDLAARATRRRLCVNSCSSSGDALGAASPSSLQVHDTVAYLQRMEHTTSARAQPFLLAHSCPTKESSLQQNAGKKAAVAATVLGECSLSVAGAVTVMSTGDLLRSVTRTKSGVVVRVPVRGRLTRHQKVRYRDL
jgi:hypothetical protein